MSVFQNMSIIRIKSFTKHDIKVLVITNVRERRASRYRVL